MLKFATKKKFATCLGLAIEEKKQTTFFVLPDFLKFSTQ
jgi:hypothetical protein